MPGLKKRRTFSAAAGRNGNCFLKLSVKEALVRSLNTVPVRILKEMLSLKNSFDYCNNNFHLNFSENDMTYSSLAVGGSYTGVTTLEMAAAFDRAGVESIDVHMTDILSGRVSLKDFQGLVACGGFSYGDVLGAGEGWAKSILFNEKARKEFENFFHRKDTFTLGVCNGCQMVSNLKDLIPGAEHWPRFVQNLSERFEARFVSLKVEDTPSILLKGMAGSVLPIAVAHGEGRAEFASRQDAETCVASGLVSLRYVDGNHQYTERYPLNPNGSPFGITGLTSKDGRALIMMPHPERVFRTVQYSWHPADWGEDGPWMKLFRNAREFVG